ncbi:MAG: class I SAM-dependent RNA methyltransferase [Rhizobiales bacterium]|nr:class I SAM-dependent RNA methyltransferase [Hyphomicrobiales bacterium]MBI3673854.1 class I SAM-dependent RNA methyltransferase [Hyphomicrobiales bacterium]
MAAFQLKIERLGHRGEGMATLNGNAAFIPYALPGETILVEIEGEAIRLVSIESQSLDRIPPFCSYFGRCGGCLLQHFDQSAYRSWKRGLVQAAFAKRGIDAAVADLVDAHGQGRRRASLHVRRHDGVLKAGFMALRSHDLQDIDRCPILVPMLDRAIDVARSIGEFLGDCDVALTATNGGVDAAAKAGRKVVEFHVPKLAILARKLDLARLTVNGEIIVVHRSPAVNMGAATVILPPNAFLQATEAGETVLAGLVTSAAVGAKRVADLFCGCGPFALRLAASARVTAVDSDKPSIAALGEAARRTTGIKPFAVSTRDLSKEPLTAAELKEFDAVVFDPPRAGAEAQARQFAKSKVGTVVAVSCEPSTLVRDAGILMGGGYRLEQVTPVDQFKWSPHVEMVAVFRRN